MTGKENATTSKSAKERKRRRDMLGWKDQNKTGQKSGNVSGSD